MLRISTLIVVLLSVATSAFTQTPEASRGYSPEPAIHNILPYTVTTFSSSSSAATSIGELRSSESAKTLDNRARVLRRPTLMLASQPASRGNKPDYRPVLYSALIPGTGEMALGHWVRGSLMLALEITAWSGYSNFHSDGLDRRTAYENFADNHWATDRWISQHEQVYLDLGDLIRTPAQMDSIGQTISGQGIWPGFIPWVSISEDKQHFYENIGKYDWYISGWDDYDPDVASADHRDTPIRDEYRQLRIASNDKLKTANRFVFLSIITRVVSVVQTALMVRSNAREAGRASLENHMEISTRTTGLGGGQLVLEYHFK